MISLLVFLIFVGVIIYLVNTIIPLPSWIKTVINVLAALFVFLYVLDFFGLYHFPRGLR